MVFSDFSRKIFILQATCNLQLVNRQQEKLVLSATCDQKYLSIAKVSDMQHHDAGYVTGFAPCPEAENLCLAGAPAV